MVNFKYAAAIEFNFIKEAFLCTYSVKKYAIAKPALSKPDSHSGSQWQL